MLLVAVLALGPQVLGDLGLDNGLGDVEGDLAAQVLEEGVTGGDRLLAGLALGDLLDEVLAQLLDGVELGGELGELVVDLGQLTLLDGSGGHRDLGLLTGVLPAGQLGGEGGGLVGLQAAQGGVQALEHVAFADLVGDARDGVDLLAVDDGLEVNGDEVTGLGLAAHGLQGAEAGTQVVQLGVDVLIGDLDGVHGQLGLAQVRQLDDGANSDLGGEGQLAAVLAGGVGQLDDVDLGLEHGDPLGLGDGVPVEVGELVVDGLLDDGPTADALVDDPVGDVTATEAGDLDLGADLLVGGIQAGLELLIGDLNGQLDATGVKILDSGLHGGCSQGLSSAVTPTCSEALGGRASVASIRAILGQTDSGIDAASAPGA